MFTCRRAVSLKELDFSLGREKGLDVHHSAERESLRLDLLPTLFVVERHGLVGGEYVGVSGVEVQVVLVDVVFVALVEVHADVVNLWLIAKGSLRFVLPQLVVLSLKQVFFVDLAQSGVVRLFIDFLRALKHSVLVVGPILAEKTDPHLVVGGGTTCRDFSDKHVTGRD